MHIKRFFSACLLLVLLAGCAKTDSSIPSGQSRGDLLEETDFPAPTSTPTPSPTPTATPTPEPLATVLRDYEGWDVSAAYEALDALDLGLKVTIVEADFILSGVTPLPDTVVYQEPQAGTILYEGDSVVLYFLKEQQTAAIDKKGYSTDEIISYFCETVMHSEYYDGDEPEQVRKWTSPIYYVLRGVVTTEDVALINRLTAALNEIPGFPGIYSVQEAGMSEEDANYTIQILPYDEYQEFALDRIGDAYTDGYATAWFSNYVYTDGEVGICNDIDRETKNSVILEEIIQSLGIFNDSHTYPDSLFYQNFNTPQWPTDIDWLMVETLYREELTPGMTEEEAVAVLRGLLDG